MLKKLKDLLKAGGSGPSDGDRSALASLETDKNGTTLSPDLITQITVLLIHAASVDEDVSREEAEAICSLVEYNLGVPQEQIPDLVSRALELKRTKPKVDDFVPAINASFSMQQRVRILAMIWKLVLADNKLEREEERGIFRFSSLMQISLDDQEKARRLAEDNKV